ncbi:serine hydrolase [Selenomonas sp. AE3005]|uniref:serine hydrolase n=1 Tax=Selenomonas sp. AE3005 TaxID=1485543 RepID=UPI001E32C963|nr:serine hydrolase [Selenomonas sp. AE3005]
MTGKRFTTFIALLLILQLGALSSVTLWQRYGDGAAASAAEMTAQHNIKSGQPADLAALAQNTQSILGTESKGFSVYFLRPEREVEPYIHNQRAMMPASMIKLFVMAKVMQDVHDKRLFLDEQLTIKRKDVVGGAGVITWYNAGERRTILQLVKLMITDSDNTATNMLIDRVGLTQLNAYLSQQGFKDTVIANKMMTGNRGRKNFSSVRDIGHLLTRMYYRELVAEEEDSIMLDILLEQNDKECFPKALPAYKIAHKTGEIDGVFADGGIFFGPQGTFILVAINEHYAERMDAITKMQKLAQYYAGTLGE